MYNIIIEIITVFQAEVCRRFSRPVAVQRAVQPRQTTCENTSHDRQIPQTTSYGPPPHSANYRSRPSSRSRSVLRLDAGLRHGCFRSSATVRLRPERPPSGRTSGPGRSGTLACSHSERRPSTQLRRADEQRRYRR